MLRGVIVRFKVIKTCGGVNVRAREPPMTIHPQPLERRFGRRYNRCMNDELSAAVRSFGASDCGIFRANGAEAGLPFGLSVVVRLSDAIVDEIGDEPTYTYFNHYRSVNYLIDQILLRAGLLLQERGARYITVAASQSRPDSPYEGRFSHKKAACLAGLGFVGRNGLFLHADWGARVRLGTLFTDWPDAAVPSELATGDVNGVSRECPSVVGVSALPALHPSCAHCRACSDSCPAGAIGVAEGAVQFDAKRCSDWMKKQYQHIGRGAVCGICMRTCPAADGNVRKENGHEH
jgi:ferredoxin